ncbi:hypothetical protein IW262DRAFT_1302422 [Armillaria fumosa]|nr:hypothetical protein IW262DRAFT_1302422 [Armillaria fumosa]
MAVAHRKVFDIITPHALLLIRDPEYMAWCYESGTHQQPNSPMNLRTHEVQQGPLKIRQLVIPHLVVITQVYWWSVKLVVEIPSELTSKSRFKRTDAMMDSFILFSLSSGLITSLNARLKIRRQQKGDSLIVAMGMDTPSVERRTPPGLALSANNSKAEHVVITQHQEKLFCYITQSQCYIALCEVYSSDSSPLVSHSSW